MSRRMLIPLPAVLLLTGVLVGGGRPRGECPDRERVRGSDILLVHHRGRSARPPDPLIGGNRAFPSRAGQAGGGPSSTAVIALAGGPGQAALPFAEFTAKAIAPALTNRDLLVFDQRGTGARTRSAARRSKAEVPHGRPDLSNAARSNRSGPARRAFTTQESVADIEALRQAAGYHEACPLRDLLRDQGRARVRRTLPRHVEALLLDSVVPDRTGPNRCGSPRSQAVAPVIRELCSAALCAGITSEPARRPRALSRRDFAGAPLSGSVYDGVGPPPHAPPGRVRPARNPRGRRPQPGAARAGPRRLSTRPCTATPTPCFACRPLAEGLIPNVPQRSADPARRR